MEKRTQTPTTDLKQDNKTQELVNARKDTLSKLKTEEDKGFEWLNEYSRKFLASGYLTEGVTPEERIREIGDRAEEILQIPGYSDKFYGYMSEGFFSLASPVWSNFGKKRGLPISCVGSHIDDDMVEKQTHSRSELRMVMTTAVAPRARRRKRVTRMMAIEFWANQLGPPPPSSVPSTNSMLWIWLSVGVIDWKMSAPRTRKFISPAVKLERIDNSRG